MKAFKSTEGKQAVLAQYDAFLEHFNIPYEELHLGTRYGNTYAIAVGSKETPPVILLHGSGMNSAMWIRDMEVLSSKYRVYAADLPGEPGKSSEEQLPFDSMDYANWLDDVYSALGIDEASLVGISLGAWLAAIFTIMHPEKALKLVLLCPAGFGGQNLAFKDIAMPLLMKGEEGANELFRLINGGSPIPETVLNYQKLIAAVFNTRQEPIPLFTDQELGRLNMPVLLIVGGKDIILNSKETAERAQEHLPNVSVIMLPNAGHALTGHTCEIMEHLATPA